RAAAVADVRAEVAALEDAERAGAAVGERLTALRDRLRASEELDRGLAAVDALAAKGDVDAARAKLDELAPRARDLGREKDLAERAKKLDQRAEAGRTRGRAQELCAKARGFLSDGAIDTAAQAADQARVLAPDLPELKVLDARVRQARSAPEG